MSTEQLSIYFRKILRILSISRLKCLGELAESILQKMVAMSFFPNSSFGIYTVFYQVS